MAKGPESRWQLVFYFPVGADGIHNRRARDSVMRVYHLEKYLWSERRSVNHPELYRHTVCQHRLWPEPSGRHPLYHLPGVNNTM